MLASSQQSLTRAAEERAAELEARVAALAKDLAESKSEAQRLSECLADAEEEAAKVTAAASTAADDSSAPPPASPMIAVPAHVGRPGRRSTVADEASRLAAVNASLQTQVEAAKESESSALAHAAECTQRAETLDRDVATARAKITELQGELAAARARAAMDAAERVSELEGLVARVQAENSELKERATAAEEFCAFWCFFFFFFFFFFFLLVFNKF
jgi:chromosome segregation ATPase